MGWRGGEGATSGASVYFLGRGRAGASRGRCGLAAAAVCVAGRGSAGSRTSNSDGVVRASPPAPARLDVEEGLYPLRPHCATLPGPSWPSSRDSAVEEGMRRSSALSAKAVGVAGVRADAIAGAGAGAGASRVARGRCTGSEAAKGLAGGAGAGDGCGTGWWKVTSLRRHTCSDCPGTPCAASMVARSSCRSGGTAPWRLPERSVSRRAGGVRSGRDAARCREVERCIRAASCRTRGPKPRTTHELRPCPRVVAGRVRKARVVVAPALCGRLLSAASTSPSSGADDPGSGRWVWAGTRSRRGRWSCVKKDAPEAEAQEANAPARAPPPAPWPGE